MIERKREQIESIVRKPFFFKVANKRKREQPNENIMYMGGGERTGRR